MPIHSCTCHGTCGNYFLSQLRSFSRGESSMKIEKTPSQMLSEREVALITGEYNKPHSIHSSLYAQHTPTHYRRQLWNRQSDCYPLLYHWLWPRHHWQEQGEPATNWGQVSQQRSGSLIGDCWPDCRWRRRETDVRSDAEVSPPPCPGRHEASNVFETLNRCVCVV